MVSPLFFAGKSHVRVGRILRLSAKKSSGREKGKKSERESKRTGERSEKGRERVSVLPGAGDSRSFRALTSRQGYSSFEVIPR